MGALQELWRSRDLEGVVGVVALAVTALLLPTAAEAATRWENPLPRPAQNDVVVVDGVAWAVGENGLVIRRSPSGEWLPEDTGSTFDLAAAWASSASNVIAVGVNGRAMHWDGMSWTWRNAATGQHLFDVHGSSPSNVYAVGGYGNVVRWDGSSWSVVGTGPTLTIHSIVAVWVFGTDDVYLGGAGGRIFHCSANCQSVLSYSEETTLAGGVVDFFGRGADDLWAIDTGGYLYQRTGASWSSVPTTSRPSLTRFLWGTDDELYTSHAFELWVFDGADWGRLEEAELVVAKGFLTMGGPEDDLVAVSYGGIYSSPGSGWRRDDTGPLQRIRAFTGSGDEVFAASSDGYDDLEVLTRSDDGWSAELVGISGSAGYGNPAVAARSVNDYFVGGGQGVFHWNGSSWSNIGQGVFADLWPAPSGELFGVSGDQFAKMDSSGLWHLIPLPDTGWNALWGDAANSLWAVGDGGKIFYYDGSSAATQVSGTSEDLNDIHGVGGGTVFAGGDSGKVLRKVGAGAWQDLAFPNTNNVYSVWGEAAGSVWAVAQAGTGRKLWHWDGATWEEETLPDGTFTPRVVWGTSPIRIFVAGSQGRVFSYTGSWSEVTTDFDASIERLAGGDNFLLAGGAIAWDTYAFELTSQWRRVALPPFWARDIWWHEDTGGRVVVGHSNAYHFDGFQWKTATEIEDSGSDSVVTSRQVNAVWGRAPNDVIAVGRQKLTVQGTILQFDGTDWSEADIPTSELFDVDGTDTEAVAVGADGLIVSGTNWVPASTPVSGDLVALDFCPDGKVWVVGEDGVILTRNGSVWEEVASGTSADLGSVACVSATEAWIAGGTTGLLRWNGVSWSPVTDNPAMDFQNVLHASGQEIFAGGFYGAIAALKGILYGDGFESGDASGWSSTVPP